MKKHLMFFGRAFTSMIQRGEDPAILLGYDEIIMDDHVYHAICNPANKVPPEIQMQLYQRALLYGDPWGKSRRYAGPYGWVPGPEDEGDPPARYNGKTWVFLFDDKHVRRFSQWMGRAAFYPLVRGIFLDDFYDDRHHWEGKFDVGDEDNVWDGWRNGRGWNARRMGEIEWNLNAFTALSRKELVLNSGDGRSRTIDRSRVLWEGLAPDDWDDLGNAARNAQPGDLLHMSCLDGNGDLLPWMADHWRKLVNIAKKNDCSIGRKYAEWPADNRGTFASNTEDPNEMEKL